MGEFIKGIPVIFENDSCVIFNKPPGLSVQGGKGIGVSLDSIISENIDPRPFLVHRLDRDTSGVILIAKTKESAALFSALFASKQMNKRYLGVCSGIPETETGVIRLDLEFAARSRTKSHAGERISKKSETFFKSLGIGQSMDDSFSLLEIELGTGRMHQIRRHLFLIKHPLLGDDKYGDFPLNKKLRKTMGLKNLLLHASALTIPPMQDLPAGLHVSAPLPDFFSGFIAAAFSKPLTGT